jgi:hypothetical protein
MGSLVFIASDFFLQDEGDRRDDDYLQIPFIPFIPVRIHLPVRVIRIPYYF